MIVFGYFIIILFKEHLGFNIKYEKDKILPDKIPERWFSPVDRSLRRELKKKNLTYWFDTTNFKEVVDLKIGYSKGYFQFYIPRDRLTTSSARLFGLWITLPALLMKFRPSGALEIRKAGLEFDKMRKRIIRHLNQRSEMLSGISHDLRTPLTRIKLQIAMIKDKSVVEKLSRDVDEMEKMLNEYLQFARSGAKDKTETFDISVLLEDICKKYEKPNIKYFLKERVYFDGRKNYY